MTSEGSTVRSRAIVLFTAAVVGLTLGCSDRQARRAEAEAKRAAAEAAEAKGREEAAAKREAERLAKAGVKEILVISQDTSAYGLDLKYQPSLWQDREVRTRFLDLAQELGELGIWVRLHYVYPYPHVDEVIPLMAEGRILPYLDIPFQHASPTVLKAMRRPAHQEKTLERIRKWREICPDLAIRSTFIVGFPGETEEGFTILLDWLKEVWSIPDEATAGDGGE